MSSICSNASSINFRGEEVEVDVAIDSLFQEIQQNLNNCQCSLRELSMSEERADTFLEAVGHHFEIDDYVDTLLSLFSELKGVSKQCLGTCPKEHKDEYKKLVDDRKEAKKRLKAEERAMKAMSLSEIKEE